MDSKKTVIHVSHALCMTFMCITVLFTFAKAKLGIVTVTSGYMALKVSREESLVSVGTI